MLKGIPAGISPDLLKVLAEMGHGDTLVIGDANFAAASLAQAGGHINIRADGQGASELLDQILQLFPLDTFVDKSVMIMDKAEMHKDLECPIWEEFSEIVARYDERGKDTISFLDRYEFYEKAKEAYAIVSTSETAFYACIILQKGAI